MSAAGGLEEGQLLPRDDPLEFGAGKVESAQLDVGDVCSRLPVARKR